MQKFNSKKLWDLKNECVSITAFPVGGDAQTQEGGKKGETCWFRTGDTGCAHGPPSSCTEKGPEVTRASTWGTSAQTLVYEMPFPRSADPDWGGGVR